VFASTMVLSSDSYGLQSRVGADKEIVSDLNA
jgi:hypothetical protein